MTDTTPLGLIVVRLKVPVKNYPVGTELGYKDVPDAIAALGSAAFFDVVRDQQGNPIPPLTPEEIEEAQRAAQRRAKARRLILGADFDPLWNRVEGIPSAEELTDMQAAVDAVADVPPRVEAVETKVSRVDPGEYAGAVGESLAQGPSGPAWRRDAVSADWFSDINDAVAAARSVGDGGLVLLSPDVTYHLVNPIQAYAGLVIRGERQTSSVIVAPPGASAVQVADPADRVEFFQLINVALRGNYTDTPIGLDARGMSQSHFDMLRIVGFTQAGVYWGGNSADGYVAGWSNSFWRGNVIANNGSSGMLFDGVTATSAATSNYMDIRRCNINLESKEGTVGIDMRRGDGNLIDHCDIGYGLLSTPIRLEYPAAYNTFAFNRVEGVQQSVVVKGSTNRFIANHLAGVGGVKHPVEVHYPGKFNQFIGNSYSTSALTPYVLEVLGPGGESSDTVTDDTKEAIRRQGTLYELGAGANGVRFRRRGDAADSFAINDSGSLQWLDNTTGGLRTRFRLVTPSQNVYAWDDNTYIRIPKVTSLPAATSARRGAIVRTEGATGVADGLYVCRKKDDDAYEWVSLTP